MKRIALLLVLLSISVPSHAQNRSTYAPPQATGDLFNDTLRLCDDLMKFKGNPVYWEKGLELDSPFHAWLDAIEHLALDDASREARWEMLQEFSIGPGQVEALGYEYIETKGEESELSRFIREQLNMAIQANQNKKAGGRPLVQPPPPLPPQPQVEGNPYKWRLIGTEAIQEAGLNALRVHVHLDTDELPDEQRMKDTAKFIWQNSRRPYDKMVVYMIGGPIKDFKSGAYGIATIDGSGVKLEIKNIEPKTTATEPVNLPPPDSFNLPVGGTYYVEKVTPIYATTDDSLTPSGVIPSGGLFRVYGRKLAGSGDLWYRIYAIDTKNKPLGQGWIQRTSLEDQNLRLYQSR